MEWTKNNAIAGRIYREKLTGSTVDYTTISGTPTFGAGGVGPRWTSTATINTWKWNPFSTPLDDIEIRVRFTIERVDTTSFGFRMGLYSVLTPNVNGTIAGGIRTTTSQHNLYNSYFNGTAVQNIHTSDSMGTATVGDAVQLSLIFSAQNYRMKGYNERSGITVYSEWEWCSTLDNLRSNVPPAWQLFFNSGGATIDFDYIEIYSLKASRNSFMCIGDSITDKSFASYQGYTWSYRLKARVKHAVVLGMPGFNAAQINTYTYPMQVLDNHLPKYALLLIGANDNASVSTATWEAGYDAVVTRLKGKGITVIHLLNTPRAAGSQTTSVNAINARINTLYAATDKIVDIWTPLQSGGIINPAYTTDDLHFNDAGQDVIYATVSAACPELFA